MSIEANTYEELHICNVNDKTAQLCGAVSEYLLKTRGINFISLTVDGCTYESAEDETIEEASDLYNVCQGLASAKEISLKLRSCNGGGANWRLESAFMKLFTDDAELRGNVTYRSTDYYDTDSGVEMYLYNENGLQRVQYTNSADCVADIKEWYCYTPTFRIADEEQQENAELHERIMAIVNKLCGLLGLTEDDMEDRLDDNWENYGEIVLSGSVRFATKDIPAIKELINQLAALETSEFEFEIYAVPDGEGDYDFASVAIEATGTKVKDSYCRF
jgi:hypothetical protein